MIYKKLKDFSHNLNFKINTIDKRHLDAYGCQKVLGGIEIGKNIA